MHLIDAQVVIDLGAHPDPLVRIGNGTPRTLTVDRALIDARPDLVSRFLSVVVGAGDWAARHPAETVAYIGRETRASDEWVRYAYGADVHRHLETGPRRRRSTGWSRSRISSSSGAFSNRISMRARGSTRRRSRASTGNAMRGLRSAPRRVIARSRA